MITRRDGAVGSPCGRGEVRGFEATLMLLSSFIFQYRLKLNNEVGYEKGAITASISKF